nr:hypothetical protein GCM10020093_018170 [Planobispora longispora]
MAWEDDGGIAFMGRLDRQVKVQGQRVEIGEVESALRAHPAVLQAVVDFTGELVAYVTPRDAPGLAALREDLSVRLPPYMLPSRLVRLDLLPLNSSGKVDLAALRAAGATRDGDSARNGATTTGTGEEDGAGGLAGIWARVLRAPPPATRTTSSSTAGTRCARCAWWPRSARSSAGRSRSRTSTRRAPSAG